MSVEAIVKKMTLQQKALMMSGATTWKTQEFKDLGIPAIFLSDGPTGLRKQAGEADHLGLNASLPSTCYPTAATLANSWDVELLEEVGNYLSDEMIEQGVDVLLGPGLNIKRNPLCGRNFEYYSEDPYLSGKLAAAMIRGIQSNGVSACPKHFAVNSQELHRMSNDSIVDDRTLHEIYLTGFEIAVKEGQPKSLMSSYNKINGVYANEHEDLLQNLLRDQWGFDGFVVSDWGGSNDHPAGVKSGSHLEMPATGIAGAQEIVAAVQSGELSENMLDQRVAELLSVVFSIYEQKQKASSCSNQLERHAFVRRAAADSIVLMKNEKQFLPLAPQTKVALIGDFAKIPRYQGAGSSLVNTERVETLLVEIEASELLLVGYAQGYERLDKENEQLLSEAKLLAEKAEKVILSIGLTEISEVEGLDREHMRLPENQIKLLKELAQVNANIVVVLSGGSAIEMPWLEHAQAVVHSYLGGESGAGAVLDILTGKVNPSARLNETYPIAYESHPSCSYYPGKEATSEYREGIFVGYRYFTTNQIPVRFPFGFGLSYTSFVYSDFKLSSAGIQVTVTNTGKYDGAEVVQLYIGKKDSALYRCKRELKQFTKLFLKKGESRVVELAFDDKAFRVYDTGSGNWIIEKGSYEIMLGKNADEIIELAEVQIEGEVLAVESFVCEQLAPYYSGSVLNVDDETFTLLLGRPLSESRWNQKAPLGENDTLSQMFYAKSWLARRIYGVLTRIKDKSIKKGKPNLNILFNYNMTFRTMAKMTGGVMNREMVQGVLKIVNGHFFRGINQLIKGFFANRRLTKQTEWRGK